MLLMYSTDEHYDEILRHLAIIVAATPIATVPPISSPSSPTSTSTSTPFKYVATNADNIEINATFRSNNDYAIGARYRPCKRIVVDDRRTTNTPDIRRQTRKRPRFIRAQHWTRVPRWQDEIISTFFVDDLITNVRTFSDEQLDSLYNLLLTDHYLRIYDTEEHRTFRCDREFARYP